MRDHFDGDVSDDHAKIVRAGLRPKDRFTILERDNFTCQYCGAKAPDAVLEVDHIKPVSKGGTNDPENLTTACAECNIGKGADELPEIEGYERMGEIAQAFYERPPDLVLEIAETFASGALNGDDHAYATDLAIQAYHSLPMEAFVLKVCRAYREHPKSLAQRCLMLGSTLKRLGVDV